MVFAWQGFVQPQLWRIAFEIFGCAVLSLSAVRFTKPGWQRSPLWPGLITLAITALLVDLKSLRDLVWIVCGIGALTSLGVRWIEARRPVGLLGGMAMGLVGALGARYLIHEKGVSQGMSPGSALTKASAGVLSELVPSFPQSATGSDGPPVVVITLDTLRWDQMQTMSATQRLAERGVYWPRAMSTSSWTLSAMASMQTGVYVYEHGAAARMGGGFQGIKADLPTLPERLAQAGYQNHAVISNGWLTGSLGFYKGFHRIDSASDDMPHRLTFAGFPLDGIPGRGDYVTDRALASLDRLPNKGAYLWVHYVDAHLPYQHIDESHVLWAKENLPTRLVTDDEIASMRAAYDGEVELMDEQVNRLLDALEAKGWMDEALIIMTSDHGEEFWDHGGRGHGHSHHTEVVDVGLVISGPGFSKGQAPGGGVPSLVDIAPTITAVTGVEPVKTHGFDLAKGVPAGSIRQSWGNFAYRVERAARDEHTRAIVNTDCELLVYDLDADPDEQHPLLGMASHPVARAAAGVAFPELSSETDIDGLEALGYVDSEGGMGSWDVCPQEAGLRDPAVAPPPAEPEPVPEAPSDPTQEE